jgi:adenylate kinase
MMRIVLMGAPGSGKGTQAQRLQAKYRVPQVSSGDLLRDAVARGTELGQKAKAVMEAGQLVSDEIVLGLIRERLSRPDAAMGFILDGYPRNIDQANALARLLDELGQPLQAVLLLDVQRDTLMKRLAGRRVCPKCGTVYNVHSMPSGATGCSKDGAELYQRPDDKEEVIGKRLEVYEQQTRPLVDHYASRGLLRVVAGEGELDDVFERMESAALAQSLPASKITVATSNPRPPKRTAAPRRTTAQAGSKSRDVKRARVVKSSRTKPAAKKAAAKKTAAAKKKGGKTAKKATRKSATARPARNAKARSRKLARGATRARPRRAK